VRVVFLEEGVVPRPSRTFVVVATDRRAEVTQAIAERPRDFGQTLGPEDQKGHDEDEQQVSRLQDVGNHSTWRVPVS
jgi:hypothetical protein